MSPNRTFLSLSLALLPLLIPHTFALDFSNYPPTSQNCLYQAAAQSSCNGLQDLAFNICACSLSGTFIPLAVQCLTVNAPADLHTDYIIAQANCGGSNTPLQYTEPQFLALGSSVSSSIAPSTTSTSIPTSSSSSSEISSATPTPTKTPALGGITATVNGKPLSTGAIVGIAIALLVCLGLIILAITLCCIHSRKKNNRQAVQPIQQNNMEAGMAGVPGQPGMTEYGKVGQGITTAAIPTAGPMPTAEPMKGGYAQQPVVIDPAGYRPGQQQIDPSGYQQQPDPSGYLQGQQQIDPRYSIYSNATTAAPGYTYQSEPLPSYMPGQQPGYPVASYPSPGSTVISPISGVGSSPRPGYVEIDSTQSVPTVSPVATTAQTVPVELSAAAQNEPIPEAHHTPEAAASTVPGTNVIPATTTAPAHGTEGA